MIHKHIEALWSLELDRPSLCVYVEASAFPFPFVNNLQAVLVNCFPSDNV